ncbi:MAG: methyl-accepting chemotaxis protein [Steroidobacteraceae bacterium]
MSVNVIKGWTIRRRILMSFAVVLGLMVVMGLIAARDLGTINGRAKNAESASVPGLYYSTLVRGQLILNYALTAEYLGQTDVLRLSTIEEGLRTNGERWAKAIATFESLPMEDADRQKFAAFVTMRAEYVATQREILKRSSGLDTEGANELWRSQLSPQFDKTHAAIQAVVDDRKSSADESLRAIGRQVRTAKYIMVASFLAAGVLTFICAFYLLRAITNPLDQLRGIVELMRVGDFSTRLKLEREDEFHALAFGFNRMADELTGLVSEVQSSSSRVSTSVSEIAATAKQQQATAGQIASTTIEIGATSKEISATSKELVKTMNEVATVAEQSAALAGVGQAGLAHMEDTMQQVMDAAGSINSKLAVLNEKAANINQIVTTITKVADQTSLLSLNAAIEAEKAGEHGRGFAVVATEIRRLADQTAVATYDIEQMVKHIQSAVSAGVMGMDKFSEEVRRGMKEVQEVGGQLSHIIDQVKALAPRVESVNEGMQAQSTGAEQISHALSQLTDAAQQTVESLTQSTHAIGDLDEVSSALRNGVLRFKLAS